MKEEFIIAGLCLIFIIAGLCFISIIFILVGSSGYLKNRAIKRRHQEQFQEIRNHNSNSLHLMPTTQIEYSNSFVTFFGSGGPFFALMLPFTLSFIFTKEEPVPYAGTIIAGFVVYVLVYFLLEYVFFHIRLHTGHIRGAVAFDENERKFYVFPTLNSDWNKMECKTYKTYELIYTLESYGDAYVGCYDAYVFFTNTKDKEFAFKVGDLRKNHLDEKLKYMVHTDISIPFKYKYHTDLYRFLAIFFVFILTLLLINIID